MKIVERRSIEAPELTRLYATIVNGTAYLVDREMGWEYVLDMEGRSIDMNWNDSEWWEFVYLQNDLFWADKRDYPNYAG